MFLWVYFVEFNKIFSKQNLSPPETRIAVLRHAMQVNTSWLINRDVTRA